MKACNKSILKSLKNYFRGWLPKSSSYTTPSTSMLSTASYAAKIALAMRLIYGMALIGLLFAPFGSYHSFGTPSIYGILWGFHLPVGYIGLVLGMLVILSPKFIFARKYSFAVALVMMGVLLIGSVWLFPKEYFINWLNGTSFSGTQIDIDYAVGNAVTLFIGMASIIAGIVSRIIVNSVRGSKSRI